MKRIITLVALLVALTTSALAQTRYVNTNQPSATNTTTLVKGALEVTSTAYFSNTVTIDTTKRLTIGAAQVLSGTGAPYYTVSAPTGSLYLRVDGADTSSIYVKYSGTDSTGWKAK